MIKFNPETFYRRHNKEIEKFIFNPLKTLHIVSDDVDTNLLENFCEYLLMNKNEDIDLSLKSINNKFDLIIITDLLENQENISEFFDVLYSKLNDNGKLLVTSVNNIWYPILNFFELIGLKKKSKKRVYTSPKKLKNILSSNKYSYIQYHTRQYFPFQLFGIGDILNTALEIIFYKLNIGIKSYFLMQKKSDNYKELSKTIIIPAKNEEKNLEPLINLIPQFDNLEIIIACGQSEDKTIEVSNQLKDSNLLNIKVIEQTGKGKANAVFEALEISQNDLISILDADISVDPKVLDDVFKIIENGEADFVNCTRFVYRKEKNSMRFFNVIGNKIFQYLISVVISKKLTDSLCGTKVFHKGLKDKIIMWQKFNKVRDPFGDFDLIFASAFSGQNIVEYPIHYRSRIYGKTQISRFKDGFRLFIYFLNSLRVFNKSINN
ncbi:glycosyltransferase family 2 protein [Acidimicrobiaceae bacterium]|nr:glycosyltransferase family 2 protein [Acidimicrobiaceae bacterium]